MVARRLPRNYGYVRTCIPAILNTGVGAEERGSGRRAPEAESARSARQAVRFEDLGPKGEVQPPHGLRLRLLRAGGRGEG